MGEFLKKPYEISIWKDVLVTEKDGVELEEPYFDEQMLAVIGSDTMTAPSKCLTPVLTENVNGEVGLTFSMAHRYFDNELGEKVFNPFIEAGFLVNERKVKLKYDGKWYDFIIKECEEDSESDLFNYTCTDLFVNELAKNGYHVELSQELANNQGTITELGKRVVEDIDWVIDEENSEPIRQWVQEPLYRGVLKNDIEALQILDSKLKTTINTKVTIYAGEIVYFFYSNIINRNTKNIHILRENDRRNGNWTFDDNNVAKGQNYRLIKDLNYIEDTNLPDIIYESHDIDIEPSAAVIEIETITWSEYLEFQGYRLNYGPISKYDPITEKYVDLYRAEYGSGNNKTYKDIYHYKDNEFTTSDILFNTVTNGDEFNVAEETISGWNSHGGINSKNNKIELAFHPNFDVTKLAEVPTIQSLEDKDGIIKFFFDYYGAVTDAKLPQYSYFYNSGIEDNASLLGGFVKGEKFVFRIKYDCSQLAPPTLGALVAEYSLEKNGDFTYYKINQSKIYFDFRVRSSTNENPANDNFPLMTKKAHVGNWYYNYMYYNNEIRGGHFNSDMTEYYKMNSLGFEDVVPPSKKYIYWDESLPETLQDNVWNSEKGKYVEKGNSAVDPQSGVNWWYTIAECQRPLSAEDIKKKNIGIFLLASGFAQSPRYREAIEKKNRKLANRTYSVRAVEMFRYREDGNNQMLLLGSAPEAVAHDLNCFYLPDSSIIGKEEVEIYDSIDSLANYLNVNKDKITQVYNNDCEKITSVEVSQSNYFNIIQELCEKFECWADFTVEHEENGKIKLDENNNPIKKISFHEYAGKDNFAGFKYGINLSSIQRTVDSNEFVSKLIVSQTQNEFVDGGSLSIRYADVNPLGEAYILNFSYYLNQGLIDSKQFYKYYNQFQNRMKELNQSINKKDKEYIDIHNALTKINGTLVVYNETLEESLIARQEAIDTVVQIAYESTKEMREAEDATGQTPVKDRTTIITSYEDFINAENKQLIPEDALDAINEYIGKIISSQSLISTYEGTTYQLQEEYNALQYKADGIPEYTVTISQTKDGTTASINDFVEGLTLIFSDRRQTYSHTCKFDINNKIYFINNFTPAKVEFNFDSQSRLYDEHYVCDENRQKLQPINSSGTRYVFDVNFESTGVYYLTVKEEKDNNNNLKKQLEQLRKEKKDLEQEFYKKYGRFIQEGTWQSEEYVDNNLYYLDALQTSNLSAKPKITYNINVVEVSELEGLSNYLFNVGDKTYIEDTEFFGWTVIDNLKTPVREEVIVSEVSLNLDQPEENTITVQNYKTQFEDLFNRVSAAVQTIEYNQGAYNRAASMLDVNGLINSDLLAASLNNIGGSKFSISSNGAVAVDKDGIVVTDITNTINQIKLSSKGILASTDAGVTWRQILTPEGISVNYVKSGILDVTKINIMDGNQTSFRWDKSGLNAYAFGNDTGYTYTLTTDTTIVPDKDYYKLQNVYTEVEEPSIYNLNDYYQNSGTEVEPYYEKLNYNELAGVEFYVPAEEGTEYILVINPIDELIDEYYELIDNEYVLTEDTSVVYNLVDTPIEDDLDKYYEIINIDGDDIYTQTEDTELIEGKEYYIPKDYYTYQNYVVVENPVIESITDYWILNSNSTDEPYKQLDYMTNLPAVFYELSDKVWILQESISSPIGLYEKIPSSMYDFSKYVRFDKYGVYGVKDGTDFVPESVDDIEEKANFGLTWNGFFIKNSYTDGYISITEDEDIRVVKKVNGNEINKIKIGAIEKDSSGEPLRYGIYIKNDNDLEVFKTDDEGNAVFNNVSIRGSIKASVFEYEEIQAIGGIVVVRPSTAIKDIVGYIYESDEIVGLKVIVENPAIFDDEDNNTVPNYYCRFGADSGIYKVTIDEDKVVTIHDFTGENYQFEEIIGAALVSLATITEEGNVLEVENNYGIAINSADSDNQFAKKTISLFETTASKNASDNVEIGIDYRGILGTLPALNNVSDIYTNNMVNTQGIYTNNMYIGDNNQYIAFYTDSNNDKQLRIKANQIIFEGSDGQPVDAKDVMEDRIEVVITSSAGTVFRNGSGSTTLTCTVYQGNTDITSSVNTFSWKQDGTSIAGANSRTLYVTAGMVASNAVFTCEVTFLNE